MVYRIGVIADTHYPTRIPDLPYDAIAGAFKGVRQIFHLGDIETQPVLDRLNAIAPVTAVRGDDDTVSLPRKMTLEVQGVRLGVMHGQRSVWTERIRPRLRRLWGQPHDPWNGMQDYLCDQFRGDAVHAILFGHWHRVLNAYHRGILLFNPGSVYAMNLDSIRWQLARPQSLLRRRMLHHHLKQAEQNPQRYQVESTVGVLTIGDDKTLHAEVIALPLVNHG